MKFLVVICVTFLLLSLIYIKYYRSVKRTPSNIHVTKTNEFVILNSRREWLYYDCSKSKYVFTCDKDKITIFTLTDKGNIICYSDVIVNEMGVDSTSMEISREKSPDYRFCIENRRIILVSPDESRMTLNDDLIFTTYESTSNYAEVEYISVTDSFK